MKIPWIRSISVLMILIFILAAHDVNPYLQKPVFAEEDEVYIRIDKRRNLLSVVLNDVIVYQFRVATGRQTRPTPVGEFRIVTKVVNPYYLPKRIAGGAANNPLGSRWMGLSHGNGYKYGIHGTHRPSLIGQSVSSGCIRMNNRDIEFLFRHIPLQTKVIIVDK